MPAGRMVGALSPEVDVLRVSVCIAMLTVGCAASRVEQTAAPAPVTAPPPEPPRTLFARLGGLPAVELVIDGMLKRAFADERINYLWAGTNLPRVRTRLIELVCAGTGGNCTYTGRDMVTVHKHLPITGAQFDILVGHLIATLDAAKVPEKEKGELLSVLGPMKPAIVTEAP